MRTPIPLEQPQMTRWYRLSVTSPTGITPKFVRTTRKPIMAEIAQDLEDRTVMHVQRLCGALEL